MNKKLFFGVLIASVFAISITMAAHVSATGLPAAPEITKAGTVQKATLYDNGDGTGTWEVEAIAEGDLVDFSMETGNEDKGLGSVVGVFNEDAETIWITGQHKVVGEGLDFHGSLGDWEVHSHTVGLVHNPACASGFAYGSVTEANTMDTTIHYNEQTDKTTIRHYDIPKAEPLVDIEEVCNKNANGKDVGEFFVWEFYKGEGDILCVDFDTARSHDKLISQNKNGGFECP